MLKYLVTDAASTFCYVPYCDYAVGYGYNNLTTT